MTASIFDIALQRLDGAAATLADYRGQVLLIVNVASACGLTPQYQGLEQLFEQHRARGLQVLGFPCNDFGAQEPGTPEEIGAFCESTYGVQFPLFAKVQINSSPRHPLYAALIAAQPVAQAAAGSNLRDRLSQHGLVPKHETDVLWNFEKFLVGRDGRVIGRFAPDVAPDDPVLAAAIEAALAA
jgi:glutathione peroxidase